MSIGSNDLYFMYMGLKRHNNRNRNFINVYDGPKMTQGIAEKNLQQ